MISNYLNWCNYQIIWELFLKNKQINKSDVEREQKGKENTRVKWCILPWFFYFLFNFLLKKTLISARIGLVGVIGPVVCIYVYIRPGAQSKDIK